jgi:3-oxoacyl-[acyl-carrier protein] reductase
MTEIWPGRFGDSVMLVTGGASGIGRATVERAAAEGVAVIILDRDGDGARRLAEALTAAGHRALAVTADITDDRQVAAAVAAGVAGLGPIGVLVNNAGAVRADA